MFATILKISLITITFSLTTCLSFLIFATDSVMI